MSNTTKELFVPPVDLDEALLIIGQSQPLITPGARANGVGMSTTGGCRVETDLALDITRLTELERCDVSCQIGRVRSRCCKEVFAALRPEHDI